MGVNLRLRLNIKGQKINSQFFVHTFEIKFPYRNKFSILGRFILNSVHHMNARYVSNKFLFLNYSVFHREIHTQVWYS